MRNAQPPMAGHPHHSGPATHPDRPLLLSILSETGLSDCFSLERLLDRLDQRETLA